MWESTIAWPQRFWELSANLGLSALIVSSIHFQIKNPTILYTKTWVVGLSSDLTQRKETENPFCYHSSSFTLRVVFHSLGFSIHRSSLPSNQLSAKFFQKMELGRAASAPKSLARATSIGTLNNIGDLKAWIGTKATKWVDTIIFELLFLIKIECSKAITMSLFNHLFLHCGCCYVEYFWINHLNQK